jgi:hypothetical protein
VAGVVEGVVDPGQRTLTRIRFDCVELPVRVGSADRPLEAQVLQPRQPEQVGEVFVGALFPAAGPHQLEALAQRQQVLGGGGRKEVGHAVDPVEASLRPRVAIEREQRDHAVDVHQQQRRAHGPLASR